MGGDEAADLLVIYAIANRLGKFASEVLQMPATEIDGWLAFISWEQAQRKRNQSTHEHGN